MHNVVFSSVYLSNLKCDSESHREKRNSEMKSAAVKGFQHKECGQSATFAITVYVLVRLRLSSMAICQTL